MYSAPWISGRFFASQETDMSAVQPPLRKYIRGSPYCTNTVYERQIPLKVSAVKKQMCPLEKIVVDNSFTMRYTLVNLGVQRLQKRCLLNKIVTDCQSLRRK